MTKMVRIENADTSTYKVKVKVEQLNAEGQWEDAHEPVINLDYPTSMVTVGIHSHRRLIIEETN